VYFGDEMKVDVSTAPSHPPFPILISQFVPPSQGFLSVSSLLSSSNDHEECFATTDTLPYGIRNFRLDQFKVPMQRYIEDISTCKHILLGSKTLSGKVLQAICRLKEAHPTLKGVDI
jgi:hypothetical protein